LPARPLAYLTVVYALELAPYVRLGCEDLLGAKHSSLVGVITFTFNSSVNLFDIM